MNFLESLSPDHTYVNYLPNDPDQELLDDIIDFSLGLDEDVKIAFTQKIKRLHLATWDFKESDKLTDIYTERYRGLSRCRFCGCSNGSIEWHLLNHKYIVPQGIIHLMNDHHAYPVYLIEKNEPRISEWFILEFLEKVNIK